MRDHPRHRVVGSIRRTAITSIDRVDTISTASERIDVAVVTLPGRLGDDGDVQLVRLRIDAGGAGVLSTRLGPRQLARLIAALSEAYAEAFPSWRHGERIEDR